MSAAKRYVFLDPDGTGTDQGDCSVGTLKARVSRARKLLVDKMR